MSDPRISPGEEAILSKLEIMHTQLGKLVDLMGTLADALQTMVNITWTCGCGHTNGVNLSTCAQCGRRPGQR